MQVIFDKYKDNILNPNYHPSTPIETLYARLTATWLLQNKDTDLMEKAGIFIKKTSTNKHDDYTGLKEFAAQVKEWDKLDICSLYTNGAGPFVEYKLNVTTSDNKEITRHFHALFQVQQGTCYFTSQSAPLIRVIGDPVLHKPGIPFPKKPTAEQCIELSKQIEHAKSVLIQTSGAGIAANQCAWISNPYQFTIVGVFYDVQSHVSGVAKRYPGTKFPEARIMINPSIIAYSKETQNFNHACLSVPCSNRCEVKSPQEITVAYQDPTKNMAIVKITLKDVDAVVLWHELTHIVDGKTYIDVAFNSLTIDELKKFEILITKEIKERKSGNAPIPELSVPPFYFTVKINDAGQAKLDERVLTAVLPKMTSETLSGLMNQCNFALRAKTRKQHTESNSNLSSSKALFHQPARHNDGKHKEPKCEKRPQRLIAKL